MRNVAKNGLIVLSDWLDVVFEKFSPKLSEMAPYLGKGFCFPGVGCHWLPRKESLLIVHNDHILSGEKLDRIIV